MLEDAPAVRRFVAVRAGAGPRYRSRGGAAPMRSICSTRHNMS